MPTRVWVTNDCTEIAIKEGRDHIEKKHEVTVINNNNNNNRNIYLRNKRICC